jgi:hypothetical protein
MVMLAEEYSDAVAAKSEISGTSLAVLVGPKNTCSSSSLWVGLNS